MMNWSDTPIASLLSRAGSREVVETAIGLSKQQGTTWEPILGARTRKTAKQRAKTRPHEVPSRGTAKAK
jgi:hypothetical protein